MGDDGTIWLVTVVVTAVPVALILGAVLAARRSVARVRVAVGTGQAEVDVAGGLDGRGRHAPMPFARASVSHERIVLRGGRGEPIEIPAERADRVSLSRSLLLILTYLGPQGRVRFTASSRRALCTALAHHGWEVAGGARTCGRWSGRLGGVPPGSSGQPG